MQSGMIIAQISDTHIDLDGPNGPARLSNLERCVEDINRLEPLPDVVIHTGDVAQNAKPAEYEAAKRVLGALRCPLHVAAGNRDDRAAIRAAFPADTYLLPDAPFVQYRVETFPVRLIAVDTLSESSNKGDFCRVRADSLRAALAEDTTRPTMIFMHHPPFVVHESAYPFQFESWESVERMGRALDGQRHVVGMICGHAHRNVAGTVGDVPVSSTPSVAVDLRLGRYPVEFQSDPLYKIHRIDAQRGLVSEIRAARQRSATPLGRAC
jgi:3',5'-cyclic AMP phosphodiesterase CpdA